MPFAPAWGSSSWGSWASSSSSSCASSLPSHPIRPAGSSDRFDARRPRAIDHGRLDRDAIRRFPPGFSARSSVRLMSARGPSRAPVRAPPRPPPRDARAREDRHRAIPSRDSTRHPETTARVDAPSPFLGSLGAIVEARIRDSRLARDTFSTHATQSPTHPSLSSARLRPLADPATRPPPQHPNQQHHPRRVSSAPRRARDDRPS